MSLDTKFEAWVFLLIAIIYIQIFAGFHAFCMMFRILEGTSTQTTTLHLIACLAVIVLTRFLYCYGLKVLDRIQEKIKNGEV